MAAFGFEGYSGVLARQIADSLDKKQNPPLTVGIYGAWGSGKSMLLSETAKKLKDISRVSEKRLIPVMFNAWRFEKEEHLIVPLLKTLYYEIKKIVDAENEEAKTKNKTLIARLTSLFTSKQNREYAAEIGLGILKTLVASVEMEASIGFFKAKLKGDKIIENAEKLANNDEYAKKMEKYESKYFDIHAELARFAEKIAVVFLIDDLDRCLPENVLKTLESIKLFLDVEGFAFVLAVDDDVVERGIIHRYKEYKDADDGRAIITGAEYLEKIVSLPFKIPKIEPKDSKEFFKESYPDLFRAKIQNERQTQGVVEKKEYDEKLLSLFASSVPAVPRRLIRSAELFELKKRLCEEKNIKTLIENPYLLAKFAILELFAPDIFRFGTERYRGFRFFNILSEWKLAHGSLSETEKIKNAFKDDVSQEYKENREKLLMLVGKCNNSRNGFRLDSLFDDTANDLFHAAMTVYITMTESHEVKTAEYAKIERLSDFVADILSEDREARKSAISSISGNLPPIAIDEIVANADGKEAIKNSEWWEDIYEITDETGWIRLVNELKIIDRLTDEQ